MVKCNDIVEQHQIHIPEIGFLLIGKAKLWFAVFDLIVGEISDQPAGKCWKPRKFRCPVLINNLTKHLTPGDQLSEVLPLTSLPDWSF